MFSNVANPRIGKSETFFRFFLKLLNRLKRILKTSFILGCLKRTKNAYSSREPKKNIGKVILASVQMKYFE